jgi:hypothetical protein
MSAEDDRAAERVLVPWLGGGSKSAAAKRSDAISARRPTRPGWRWNGKEWMSSARYLDDPHVRVVR